MNEHPPLSDNDLVLLTRNGDRRAFDELVRRHRSKVRAIALRMLRNPVDAQDVVQEAFMNAYRRLESFRMDAAFSSWLYRIASNCCLMRLRTRRRRPEEPLDLPGHPGDGERRERPVADPSRSAIEVALNRELAQHILAAVDTLPPNYRSVFELSDLQHRSMKQIAGELGLTVPNVKTRLHRARVHLRAALGEYLAAEAAALPG